LAFHERLRLEEITAKLPFVEAKLKRNDPDDKKAASPPTPSPGTRASQVAGEGGVIEASGIQAPASAGAAINQSATGKGSKIKDSPIKLE
jgi:hypothetical protein